MPTVSHLVKKEIDSRPSLQDALIEDIVNYSSLASRLHPAIESEMGKTVKRTAVIMALHRHAEKLREKARPSGPFKIGPEIIMKTGLCDICVVRTPSANERIREVHDLVDYAKGDTLNVIQGNYEIALVVSERHMSRILEILKGESVLNTETDLVSLTMTLSRDFLTTPGILSHVTRKLAWDDINIYENISTMTELIFILREPDAVRAYNTFREIIREQTDHLSQ